MPRPKSSGTVTPRQSIPPQFMREALEWSLRMSGARRVLLWRIDHKNGEIICTTGTGGALPSNQRAQGDPLAWAAREGLSLRLDAVPSWSNARQVFAIPVRTIDGADAVATFEIDDPAPIQTARYDGLGVYLGGMMSIEGERAQLGEQHARAGDLINALRALPEATDADALCRELARAVFDITAASGCVIALWSGDQGNVVAAEGEAPGAGTTFRGTESETALAARAGTTLVRAHGALGALPMVAAGERFAHRPIAMVAVPLKIGTETIGVMTAWSEDDIARQRIQNLETLAPYAALQLVHTRELAAMRTLAQHDRLTGLSNRMAFEEFLAAEGARYDRYERPFTVVLLDIDHFKSVNDTYGHEAGDEVLKQVSVVIRESLRSVDLPARLGGEEFVVVLPETGIAQGCEIAERIRERVAAQPVEWRGQRIDVRISAGVASLPESVRFANQLVRSADAALYASKRNGRNRVTAAQARTVPSEEGGRGELA